MRPRAGTEGAGGAKRGSLRLCCRAVRVSIVESRIAGVEQRPRQKRDPETVFLGVALGAGVGSGLGCGGEIDDDDEGEDLGVSGAGAGAEVFRDCQGAVWDRLKA